MNLEDPFRTSPLDVFDVIAAEVGALGGKVTETEVIGMLPDTLVLSNCEDRLKLPDPGHARRLSERLQNTSLHDETVVGGRAPKQQCRRSSFSGRKKRKRT